MVLLLFSSAGLFPAQASAYTSSPGDNPRKISNKSGPPPSLELTRKSDALQPLGSAESAVIDGTKGGELATKDNKVKVVVPAGALGEPIRLQYTPLKPWTSNRNKIIWVFDLKPFAVNRGDAEVKQFQKELEITLSYSDKDLVGFDEDSLHIYWLDEAKKSWLPLESQLDREKKTVSAKTNHFSIFGGQAYSPYALPGQILDFQNDLHSGTA